MNGPLVLSLFPGIGLLDMAFEHEGFCVVRGPDVLWGGDVRRFHPPTGRFDGVIGGPPCQSFSSLAHLVRANGHEPKFGNLIPEFERCIVEAQPAWFLMENVPQAPEPVVPGYGMKSFLLNNCWLPGDGQTVTGQEQERLRRFCFGMRGREGTPSLMRWIEVAVFMLPEGDRSGTCTQWSPNNTAEAKGRVRHEALTDGHDKPPSARKRRNPPVTSNVGGGRKGAYRNCTFTSSDGGPSVPMARYSLADACRLQGLPEGFLDDSPFRADGKLKAVANGVPIPMGRAIARAILAAIQE